MLAAVTLAACSDNDESIGPEGRDDLQRFVSIGTSVSQGTQSDGVVSDGQSLSWTAQLARAANVSYSVPLVQAPGCNPPLVAPISFASRLGAASTWGECAPNVTGVTLPSNNVAIDGANARTAATVTPEIAVQAGISRVGGELYRRVLLPGQTQLTAMEAQSPTFVSVELGANEILGGSSGLVAPNVTVTPVDTFTLYYDQIVAGVQGTGAKAVLVGLPDDLAQFPSIRPGGDLHADSATFANAFYVTVASDCQGTANLVFLPGMLLAPRTIPTPGGPVTFGGMIPRGQAAAGAGQPRPTLSCSNVPGAPDFVITPTELQALNAMSAAMNDYIQQQATDNGWAFFKLGALYDQPSRPATFSIALFMTSNEPYGPNISLDGVHPSARGHRILAAAAAQAINATYGLGIPVPTIEGAAGLIARR
jgi:lysophospholipase L1-like esterase